MAQKIRKAVIAAAGFGTRFLPQTKAMPKEMLPIVDKPIIQIVVEELVDAGIEDIIIVTGYGKRSIEDHFDRPSHDLINNLKFGGKDAQIEDVEKIANLANFIYVRQKGPQGNGTPLLNAGDLINNEPFIYAFADDFVKAEPSRFKQLLEVYEQYGGSVLGCVRAKADDDYKRYGFVGGKAINERLIKVDSIVEKPGKAAAPSDFATVSGYILEPTIITYLQKQLASWPKDQEFIQQVSMQNMIKDGHNFYALEIANGKYYDTGNKLEYLKTVVDFALDHPEVKDDFARYLRSLQL
ncbi:UTP--glucose-1-phosphate uridylyltransferase [Candidatus Saccharibacteria bacterium RIFCSPHIGHO2_12_FULL_47_16b]|nr:MAG: UTP--glucose-1-phosphate uridylyltransferase [Candidatus Saccharibacteria bacterium RIFCSPHIGHO2_12_FULL_47_16b]